jgi:hypothetical protein
MEFNCDQIIAYALQFFAPENVCLRAADAAYQPTNANFTLIVYDWREGLH